MVVVGSDVVVGPSLVVGGAGDDVVVVGGAVVDVVGASSWVLEVQAVTAATITMRILRIGGQVMTDLEL